MTTRRSCLLKVLWVSVALAPGLLAGCGSGPSSSSAALLSQLSATPQAPPSPAAEQQAIGRMIQQGNAHSLEAIGRIERNR